jgi:PAS domain S-box-containing protein
VGYAASDSVTMQLGGIEELFRRLPVALYRSTPDGEVLAANPALADLLGYESVSDLTDSTADIGSIYVDPAKRELWLDKISEDGVVDDFDIELRRQDGSTVWVQDVARAVFDDQGGLLYCEGALIDITGKVKARKARDEFVATVSHELRNPISVILGLALELANAYESFDDEVRREIAEVMARQSEDASWIIDDLLVAYREDVSQVSVASEEFDVHAEIGRVLEGVEEEIVFEADEDASRVVGDPRRTRQILRNLISNAIRYGGDDIKVITRRGGEQSIEILVCDDGAPLDPGEAERIFEPYERGSGLSDAKSVGLGLSVARKLASLMDGYITYRHDGEHSAFIVTLPAPP